MHTNSCSQWALSSSSIPKSRLRKTFGSQIHLVLPCFCCVTLILTCLREKRPTFLTQLLRLIPGDIFDIPTTMPGTHRQWCYDTSLFCFLSVKKIIFLAWGCCSRETSNSVDGCYELSSWTSWESCLEVSIPGAHRWHDQTCQGSWETASGFRVWYQEDYSQWRKVILPVCCDFCSVSVSHKHILYNQLFSSDTPRFLWCKSCHWVGGKWLIVWPWKKCLVSWQVILWAMPNTQFILVCNGCLVIFFH